MDELKEHGPVRHIPEGRDIIDTKPIPDNNMSPCYVRCNFSL